MSRALMFQGTGSGVGKSVIAAGFCRLLKNRGYQVRPYKSQNMALNSGVTPDGLEIGRAQIVQALACGVEPDARMNPILLKPQGPGVSQLIRMGKVIQTCSAREYYTLAEENFEVAKEAMRSLREECDWLVIEGAGSPAEINLQKTDIVNMRLAEAAEARVMLIGDIDRGGVFAWLKGTYDLIQPQHRPLMKGMLINKFRGDVNLLQPGIDMFAEHVPVPVLGVIPWLELDLEDEDSQNLKSKHILDPEITVAVVRLPYLSNFTDFDPLKQVEGLSLIFTKNPDELEQADLIILPGSKNTLHDMQFLDQSGISETLQRLRGTKWIMGICGGYQMLGLQIDDPHGMESGGSEKGLGMLPMNTILEGDKRLVRKDYHGMNEFEGLKFNAYEIHLGRSDFGVNLPESLVLEDPNLGVVDSSSRLVGTYLHGLLESPEIVQKLLYWVSGKHFEIPESFNQARERELDELAAFLEEHCKVDQIFGN